MNLSISIDNIHYEYEGCFIITNEFLKKNKNFYLTKYNSLGDIIMIINYKKYSIYLNGDFSLLDNKFNELKKNTFYDSYYLK